MQLLAKLQSYRYALIILATVGLLGLNGIFVYYALLEPQVLAAAFRNPVSLVFVVEAFILVGFTAFVIRLSGVERPGWIAFMLMSLVGGLVFSVPLFLLLHTRNRMANTAPVTPRDTALRRSGHGRPVTR